LNLVSAKASIHAGLSCVDADGPHADCIISRRHPAKEQGVGPTEVLDRVTMQFFVAGIA